MAGGLHAAHPSRLAGTKATVETDSRSEPVSRVAREAVPVRNARIWFGCAESDSSLRFGIRPRCLVHGLPAATHLPIDHLASRHGRGSSGDRQARDDRALGRASRRRLRVGERPRLDSLHDRPVPFELRAGRDAPARRDSVVVARSAALRPLVGPARRTLADPRRHPARRNRRGRRGDLAGLPARAAARAHRRARSRGVPPRRGEVRLVRERPQEGERHVVLQQRRETWAMRSVRS